MEFFRGKNLDESMMTTIKHDNVRIMFIMSICVAVMELVFLIIAFLFENSPISSPTSERSVTFGLFINLLMAVITYSMRRAKNFYMLPAAGFLYYIILSFWGILVSYRHYMKGEMIITFFIVQFGFGCFITIMPIISTLTYPISFIVFYVLMYSFDKASHVNAANFFAFGIFVVIASIERYSIEVENIRQREEITEILRHDELTGLLNRHAYSEMVEHVIGKNICVGMSDIDNFKNINDYYGHMVGDSVLRSCAQLLGSTKYEMECFRYGGDEFLFIFEMDDIDYFRKKLGEWKDRVSKAHISQLDGSVSVTLGCASGKVNSLEDLTNLIKSADSELYQNKGKKKT
jgi:diguanylate cyclase (GGDEF)-like protein